MFLKKEVKFWTNVEGLSSIDECTPQKTNKYIPDWWKKFPRDEEFKTIKNCPAFIDYFSSGYVIPMWTDTMITTYEDKVFWETSSNRFYWELHGHNQFYDYAPSNIKSQYSGVIKALCPWFIKTPKGYSSYQLPLFYDFEENFSIFPGIIHTDSYHEINFQMLIKSSKEKREFLIERGKPMVQFFPFKREKFSLNIKKYSDIESIHDLEKSDLISTTKFKGGYSNYMKNNNVWNWSKK